MARTGVAKDLVMLVEVERVAWEVLVLLTGVTTVESTELGDTKLVVVVVVGEDDVGPVEDDIGTAWAAWYLAARILSRFLLFSLFCFLGGFWYFG